MGVYNNNKDGTRSTIANTIQVVDAPVEQFVSRGEFNAVVPSDTSADNKLVNDDKFDTNLNDIWKVQGELGAKNLIPYPYTNNKSQKQGVQFEDDNGSVTINGISDTTTYYGLAYQVKPFLKKGSYILSIPSKITLPKNTYLQFIIKLKDNTDNYIAQLSNNNNSAQFDITDDLIINAKYWDLRYAIIANTQIDNLVLEPMIRLASDTDNTWRPYAPTNYQLNQKVDIIAGVYLPNATNTSSKKVVASIGQTSVTFDASSFMSRYNVTSDDLDLDISAKTSSGNIVSYNNVNITGGIVTVTFDALEEQTIFICKCSVIQ